MTRTEFLSKLLKYQSLQHASTKKTNADGTWKNHKYLYIDKNGNYVYEDKTSKASADNAKGAGDDYQRYLDEQKLKKASANQSGSAKQGEAAGKAQQKYQEQQKLKKQQGYQSGSAKQGEAEGKAQQEYLNEKNKPENKIRDFISNPKNYNYTFNTDAYDKGLRDIIENSDEYKQLFKELSDTLDKAISGETEWPEWSSFYNQQDTGAKKIAEKYIGTDDKYYVTEFTFTLRSQLQQDAIRLWNSKMEEYNATEEIRKAKKDKEEEHLKKLLLTTDLAKEYGKMVKDLYNFEDSDEKGSYQFGSDDFEKRYAEFNKKVDEMIKDFKEKDTKGIFEDFTEEKIKGILYSNEYNLSHKIDPFSYSSQKNEQVKSQIISQNFGKTEESVQKAISDDVKFLEKDLNKIVDNDDEWASTWGSNFDLLMSSQGLNAACADIDTRLKNIRQEEIHDPETGLPIKAYDCTFEEDMALVNYHRQNEKGMSDSWEYSYNCSACTIAMCLRMKGYDVSANPRGSDDLMWRNDDRWGAFKDVRPSGEFNDKNEFYNYVISQPAGSYGDISVDWLGGSGHSMFYKISDDGKKFEVYCTQTNSKVDVDWLLEHSKNWELTRLDDKEVNGYAARNTGWAKYY